ncbi:CPBP family intramembrane glutamic endopeptidase [Phaeocystidibacter luteus]|uniref:CPBP family intramembrane metalloprotease n=1 Tax=Phaeocystidibacter luteus TaxID=911197 RepID=A0A6N6RJI1_9FLAO|nr:type II CAAX endopeptidase family protein [Phaeocystidibacter luteus]KAB2807341.1 CPBP family intramembrane metalloprotease [Phaeocystidibacter luteus]
MKYSLSILTIAVIVLFPHAGLIPFFGYSIPILLLTWFVLKRSNETFSDIGFSFVRFEPKALLVGVLCAGAIVAFMQLAFNPLLDSIVDLEYDDSGLNETIRGGKLQFLLMVAMGWLIGGVYEEIVFHGFIFTRLEKMIGGKYATQISFVITSLLFGLYHAQLGSFGVINALVIGMGYLGLFLFFKRNLWYAIVCHGAYNTIIMTLIYLGYL